MTLGVITASIRVGAGHDARHFDEGTLERLAVNFSRYTPTVLELLLGAGPLLWALASAAVVWRRAAQRPGCTA
jgi:hypothetical protein